MNLDVFKLQINGIKSLTSMIDDNNVLTVTMANSTKPIFKVNGNTGAIELDLTHFNGSGIDLGLLLMGISNLFTQNQDASMKPVKVHSALSSNVVAVINRDNTVKPLNKDMKKESLQLMVTRWLMDDFDSDDLDPLVGLIGLGRMVERNNGMAPSLRNQAGAHAQD